jgi:hypothetical protein
MLWSAVALSVSLSASSAQTREQYASSVTAEHWMSMCHPVVDARVDAIRADQETGAAVIRLGGLLRPDSVDSPKDCRT